MISEGIKLLTMELEDGNTHASIILTDIEGKRLKEPALLGISRCMDKSIIKSIRTEDVDLLKSKRIIEISKYFGDIVGYSIFAPKDYPHIPIGYVIVKKDKAYRIISLEILSYNIWDTDNNSVINTFI